MRSHSKALPKLTTKQPPKMANLKAERLSYRSTIIGLISNYTSLVAALIAVITASFTLLGFFVGRALPSNSPNNPPSNVTVGFQPTTLLKSYSAAVPGLGCDKGRGIWETDYANISCTPTGMLMSRTSGGGYSEEIFDGLGELGNGLPANYRVSILIKNMPKDACAGILYQDSTLWAGGYSAIVCETGNWEIDRHDSSSSFTSLKSGSVTAAQQYLLVLTYNNGQHLLTINNESVMTVTDNKFFATQSIALAAFSSTSLNLAEFEDFDFVPLAS